MFRPLAALGCVAALSACASTQTASNDAAISAELAGVDVSAVVAGNAADYVMKAGAADLFEIQSSQVALQRAQSAAVREYARMMIDHHSETSGRMMAAARSAGLNPPAPALPHDKHQTIVMLQTTPAASFDAAYMREQAAGHREALALHQNYAAEGRAPALKRLAGAAVPMVLGHLDRAERLAR